MAHKDPITGCMVADIFEVVTPDELMGIIGDMDSDNRRQENEIMNNKKLFFDKLVEYGKFEREFNGEDFHILSVDKILSVKLNSGFKESNLDIVADIMVMIDGAFKSGLIWYKHWSWAGSFYEPPDCDEQLVWLICRDCKNDNKYDCKRCPEVAG